MITLKALHHVAVIVSDYQRSKHFYTEVLGLTVLRETYRSHRKSYKLDLGLNGHYLIELFSFPNPPKRPTQPEACGLRHIAFGVDDVDETAKQLTALGIDVEPIRIDEITGKAFTFIKDPDGLPIEFYQL